MHKNRYSIDIPLIYPHSSESKHAKAVVNGKNKRAAAYSDNSGKVTGQDITTNGLICAREINVVQDRWRMHSERCEKRRLLGNDI